MSPTPAIYGGPIILLYPIPTQKYYPFPIPPPLLVCLPFLSDNSVTMTKKVVSFASTLNHKKKPIKRINKRTRLRTISRKFFNYIKSDTYMFSPLISPQSSAIFTPGDGFGEPIKKKEKKLVQELDQYLKCDCYMYAPMVLDSAVETTSTAPTVRSQSKENPSIRGNVIEHRSEKTMRDNGNRMDDFREVACCDCCTPTRRVAIKHALARKETVKHVVHQNCRPKSIPGKGLFPKETRKIAVE
ncbi:uncharacterized protein [Primulina huaijiensis]|uniref:uncharacterized protein isoform X2 n=1 Tax=Primulina huaijiensis TaxID=1492673 RepID=UPI003CC6F4C2